MEVSGRLSRLQAVVTPQLGREVDISTTDSSRSDERSYNTKRGRIFFSQLVLSMTHHEAESSV